MAADGAPEGVVVVADYQTAGRGRLGRTWDAPPGTSLLVSVLMRPPSVVAGTVTMAAAVGLRAALSAAAGVEARLKWPNDVVWPGDGSTADRKLAGILAEASWPASSGGASERPGAERATVVVGAGVNVNWPLDLPPHIADSATSVRAIVGHEVDRRDLLGAYLDELGRSYTQLVEDGGPHRIAEHWRAGSATLGRRVRIDLGPHDVVGTAIDITDDGRLVLETDDGRRTLAVGDVTHLRAGGPPSSG
jgi:BirA family biotin operon repressor/biotin-[acetyl-CoA-carboxylase] ligase